MKCLPFALTCGPLLAQMIRDSRQDPRRCSPCSCCGARMPIQPDRGDQTVRCPGCARWQRVTVGDEAPWHLTAASAEALRRTASWVRRL